MPETLVLAIGRAIERLIVDSMFGVSMILGWNLFRAGVLQEQSATLSMKEWKIRFQKVGPGVFFALFGAIGLVVALQRPLNFKMEETHSAEGVSKKSAEVSSITAGNSDLLDYVAALNTVENYCAINNSPQTPEKTAVLKAKPILTEYRTTILKNFFGDDYTWYLKTKDDPTARMHLSPEDQARYEKIDRAASRTFATNAK
jgi:hypothetical protein